MSSRNLRRIDQLKPLIEYIDKNLKKGYKMEDLKWALINQGNSRLSVEKAIEHLNKQEVKEPVKPPQHFSESEYVDMIELAKEQSFFQKIKSFFS